MLPALVIFDLDGTLVDSSPDIRNAVNSAVAPYGGSAISLQETRDLVGEGITRLMEKVAAMQSLKVPVAELVDRFMDYYSRHLVDHTTVYPGVRETLTELLSCKKAVVSNKREELSVRTLDALRLAPFFDLTAGSETTPEKKPSPLPIFYVLDKLGVAPEQAVMVGDSSYDVEAGQRAGVGTIAVAYGYRSVDVLRNADLIINHMSELPDALRKLSRR
ncbi:MAG TPA: HAD-IA family hydrolase [Dissulfurispiraceae bacterium]|nr:HAD-IA family hydrolase [Dissulfurispiraceae bacterium]